MRFYTLLYNIRIVLILNLIMSYIVIGQSKDLKNDSPVPVYAVDLTKYTGVWFEIAKIPNRFQRNCARNTTATYQLRDDGRIDVFNRCTRQDDSVIEAKGIAKVVDSQSNAKLKVSFVRLLGISLFWGDYWIIGLDENYQFAIVGTPSRKYGWILSREPRITNEQRDEIYAILEKQEYDPQDFKMTEQRY